MVDTVLVLVSVACYSQQIAPAATEFAKSGKTDGIISLVRQGQKRRTRRLPIDQYRSALGDENYDSDAGRVGHFGGARVLRSIHQPRAAQGWCADFQNRYQKLHRRPSLSSTLRDTLRQYNSGVRAQQVLTRGRLLPYLYEHSTPLEHAFTGGLRGKPLPLFSYMELLSSADVASLLRD